MTWLDDSELRVGLGCMRLPADDEPRAFATVAAAAASGITVFDTARAYEGNEALLARALKECGARARVVTKGGMSRPDGAWVPDGRAKAIRSECEASLGALDGLPIDLYLLHSPDPRTPWPTSVRALGRLVDHGLVSRVGVSNVSRTQLDQAVELAPIAAVQVALSAFDDRAVRGGVVERCEELGIALIAHSPLGGPKRAKRLSLEEAESALARLLALSPVVVPIPGATRPETARSAARAAARPLEAPPRRSTPRRPATAGEVVLVMGIPGAGKSRIAGGFVERGYARLNRDERGGSLRGLASELGALLANRTTNVVLDNTYLTRASRSYVVEAAERQGVAARCVWLDTPLSQAQANMVERLLDRFGVLPTPVQLKEASKHEQGLLAPTQQMRAARELEPPGEDEGFASVERVEFERAPRGRRAGVFVAAAAARAGWRATDAATPHLVFDWGEDDLQALAAQLGAAHVETAQCPHGGGPPICWCRPPLPGLPLAFAREHDVDPAKSQLVGTSAAHRTLAATLGARFVDVATT